MKTIDETTADGEALIQSLLEKKPLDPEVKKRFRDRSSSPRRWP